MKKSLFMIALVAIFTAGCSGPSKKEQAELKELEKK